MKNILILLLYVFYWFFSKTFIGSNLWIVIYFLLPSLIIVKLLYLFGVNDEIISNSSISIFFLSIPLIILIFNFGLSISNFFEKYKFKK